MAEEFGNFLLVAMKKREKSWKIFFELNWKKNRKPSIMRIKHSTYKTSPSKAAATTIRRGREPKNIVIIQLKRNSTQKYPQRRKFHFFLFDGENSATAWNFIFIFLHEMFNNEKTEKTK